MVESIRLSEQSQQRASSRGTHLSIDLCMNQKEQRMSGNYGVIPEEKDSWYVYTYSGSTKKLRPYSGECGEDPTLRR